MYHVCLRHLRFEYFIITNIEQFCMKILKSLLNTIYFSMFHTNLYSHKISKCDRRKKFCVLSTEFWFFLQSCFKWINNIQIVRPAGFSFYWAFFLLPFFPTILFYPKEWKSQPIKNWIEFSFYNKIRESLIKYFFFCFLLNWNGKINNWPIMGLE